MGELGSAIRSYRTSHSDVDQWPAWVSNAWVQFRSQNLDVEFGAPGFELWPLFYKGLPGDPWPSENREIVPAVDVVFRMGGLNGRFQWNVNTPDDLLRVVQEAFVQTRKHLRFTGRYDTIVDDFVDFVIKSEPNGPDSFAGFDLTPYYPEEHGEGHSWKTRTDFMYPSGSYNFKELAQDLAKHFFKPPINEIAKRWRAYAKQWQ